MAITRVGLGGSRAAYGSFSGSTPAATGQSPAPSRYAWGYNVTHYYTLWILMVLHGLS